MTNAQTLVLTSVFMLICLAGAAAHGCLFYAMSSAVCGMGLGVVVICYLTGDRDEA